MENIVCTKIEHEGLEVEFEVLPVLPAARQQKIADGLAAADAALADVQGKLDGLNAQIDRLTNHADGLDYTVAVASGILAGLVDIFFVGELSLDRANAWGSDKVNGFVLKTAKTQGYKGDDLDGGIRFLEQKFPIAADDATNAFGGGTQHHLRDFSHHPTPAGLLFSILTQFTGKVCGTDTAGIFQTVPLQGETALIGKNLPEKLLFGVINWFFHMVSDVAGSSVSVAAGETGTGLPGPVVSLLKEFSALPLFKKTDKKGNKEFSVWISKLFNGTLTGERDADGRLLAPQKFDLRTELGLARELGRQAIPVVLNECIVRGFYFIRRLLAEMKAHDVRHLRDLDAIDWKKALPFNNRTVVRMLTISTGTMTVIDLADAAIEAAVKSGGNGAAFAGEMLVRVNFVGIGRFAVAVVTDVKMGIGRSKARNRRIAMMNEKIFLLNAKVFYKQADMWLAAESAGQTVEQAYAAMQDAAQQLTAAYRDIQDSMKEIGKTIPTVTDQKLLDGMKDILEWG